MQVCLYIMCIGLATVKASLQQHSSHCKLTILGQDEGVLQQARMVCTGTPTAKILLSSTHLTSFQDSFTGVRLATSCNSVVTKGASCLVTVCSGSIVLQDSSVSAVPSIPLAGLVCGVHSSRLEVYNSTFANNQVQSLKFGDQAEVVLHSSNVSNNMVNGSGGGMWVEGSASVTFTAGSRVQGNVAFTGTGGYGGGLYVVGNARVVVDGGSSVSGNMAPGGAGLWLAGSASIVINGTSSVQSNFDGGVGGFGGGLAMDNNARVVIDGGSIISNR